MVENRIQLEQVLRGRLGAAFARHAYGMRRWVDLFAVRIPEIRDAYLAELVAEIVHNNARHARLFRERAIEHGVDPDLYVCPPEGEATYDGMPFDTGETLAYALGSLEHFGDLLAEQPRVTRVVVDDLGDELGQVRVPDLRDPHGEQIDPPSHPVGVTRESGAEPPAKNLFQLCPILDHARVYLCVRASTEV